VRDYPGSGPALVMVHGFPDNCRIYKDVAAKLSSAGCRVVTFDFLGFGVSDKPKDYAYSFDQQLADMTAVVDEMKLEMVIPVGHDAGGPRSGELRDLQPGHVGRPDLAEFLLLERSLAGVPRLHRALLQSQDPEARASNDDGSEDGRVKVRSASGQMIPLSALLKVTPITGPERTNRYNGFLSSDINGNPAPGFSSGQAQAAVERIAAETLPKGISFEWTDLTYPHILAGNSGVLIFPLALRLVFLVLAAQYESLALPFAIIMIVPMGVLAALTGVWLTGGDNNVFTQIGLIVLVGLSAKNAILIVEFARELEFEGRTPREAAVEASRLRLRPILMTSMAFIMGVVPLVTSTGAGSEMRTAMGVAVFAGMLGVTLFGIFMTPVFYVLIRRLTGNKPLKKSHASSLGGDTVGHEDGQVVPLAAK